MNIQESGEMYLETIYVLSKKNVIVRSVDVAEKLGFSRASVSRAIKVLESRGFIRFDSKTKIRLTDEGREKAEVLFERHQILTKFLIKLGVDGKTAEDDACRIEHIIGDESFEAVKNFVKAGK